MNWQPLINCALYGSMGIILVTLGFKVFDLILTKVDIEQEVAKGNTAAAILGGAVVVAIAIIAAVAIH